MFLWFNDLNDAEGCLQYASHLAPDADAHFISAFDYFDTDNENPAALNISLWDGQVFLLVSYRGLGKACNLDAMFENIKWHANALGRVRSFARVRIINSAQVVFRIEFFKLSDARDILVRAKNEVRLDVST